VLFIPGPRLARAGRTNRGGRNQVVGGQSGWVSVEGGIRDACQVAVGLLCVEWFARFSLSLCRRGFQALLRNQEHMTSSVTLCCIDCPLYIFVS
jgi:hypothetical protein